MQKIMNNQVELTKEGLEEITSELRELVDIKLPAVIARVAKAREHGDLSENAEYHSARDDQQLLQARIDELQNIIENAVIVKNTKNTNKVGMGSQVTIKKVGTKKEKTVTMVGEFEANPTANKISIGSPLGAALLNKKKGDTVVVKAPAGEMKYEIVEIK
ncbi:transcription elongation factor GreA [Candidatus Woesebacteria bacterium]|nr:transcription elongation factor GreA [Candidatus Woesebacteria bacterium]